MASMTPTPARSEPLTVQRLLEAEAWVFDLDNTLYSADHGLFDQIDVRMKAFIAAFLDIPEDEAFRVQKTYFREYGTTMRGLMLNHGLDPYQFLDFVHDIDISVIPEAPEMDRALQRLGGRKIVFTNADRPHAERILEKLGLAHHFDAIFDIHEALYIPKPELATYQTLIERFALSPQACVMVEDIARNLRPARTLGMATVWVKSKTGCEVMLEGPDADLVDFETDDLAAWLEGLSRT